MKILLIVACSIVISYVWSALAVYVGRMFVRGAKIGARYNVIASASLPSSEQFGNWKITSADGSVSKTTAFGAVFCAGDTIERVD